MMDVHVNLLKHSLVSFSYGNQEPRSSDILRSDFVPWKNTQVRIIKQGHAMRTRPGVVTDVLCNQATPSSLRIEVQLTVMGTVDPFRRLITDYDNVVVDGCVFFLFF